VSRSELQFSRVALLDRAAFFLDRHLEMNDANELSLFPGSLKKSLFPGVSISCTVPYFR
jgi:hypothetical protein